MQHNENLLPYFRADNAKKPHDCPCTERTCFECNFPDCLYPDILRWSDCKKEKELQKA